MTLRHAACALGALGLVPACSLLVQTDGLSGRAEPGDAADGGGATVVEGSAGEGSAGEGGAADGSDGSGGSGDCPAPETGLLAYYRFDETAGSVAKDCSGNGRDGTIVSPAWTSGKHGGALVLDGAATCMTIAGSQQVAASGPFTVTVFASVTAFAVGSIAGYIFAKTNKVPDARSWRFGSDTTSNYSLRIGAASGATQIATPDGQASNTWVHVTAVFDPGKRMELWVDGARLSNATTPPVDLVDDPTAPLRVGCLVTSNYFKGKLDELRLYGRALQATEIQQLAR